MSDFAATACCCTSESRRLYRGEIKPEKPRAENIRPWVAKPGFYCTLLWLEFPAPDLIAVSLDRLIVTRARRLNALLIVNCRTLFFVSKLLMFALF